MLLTTLDSVDGSDEGDYEYAKNPGHFNRETNVQDPSGGNVNNIKAKGIRCLPMQGTYYHQGNNTPADSRRQEPCQQRMEKITSITNTYYE